MDQNRRGPLRAQTAVRGLEKLGTSAGFPWLWPSTSPMPPVGPARHGERAQEGGLAAGAPRAVRHRHRVGPGPQLARSCPARGVRRLFFVLGRANGRSGAETLKSIPFYPELQSCGAAPQNPQLIRETRKSVRLPRARHPATDFIRNVPPPGAGAPHGTKTKIPTSSKRVR